MGYKKYKLPIGLFLLAIGMFGFGFALVPLYKSMCLQFGINGKTNDIGIAYDPQKVKIQSEREIEVEFIATVNNGVNWAFYPKTHKVKIHPGQLTKLSFYAENKTGDTMVVQAIPSVTPGLAAKYLKKTECFCFRQQTLDGHEAMDMPVLFHLDPDLPEDVKHITLSYTLYDVTHIRRG